MRPFRSDELARILLIAAMMAAIAVSAGQLAARVVPGFDPTLLAGLAFLVSLEGIAGDRLARQFPEASIRLRLHLSEWVVLLAALRLVISLAQGPQALAAQASRWLARPQTLVDGGLVAAGALLATVWWLGIRMSRCLEALGPEAEAPPPQESAAFYAWLTRPREDRPGEGWSRLRQHVLTGGVLLILCSGLARLDLQLALSLRHPAIAGIVGNALLYFLLGFALLAQGHYATLQARWQRQQVPVRRPLGRRWAALATGFALGVALLALLMPLRPSLALFGAAFRIIWGIAFLLEQVGLGVLAALGYLLHLVVQLLGLPSTGKASMAPPPALPAPQAHPQAPPAGWWEALQGLVLWAALAATLVYSFNRLVREQRGLWAAFAGRGLLAWLARLIISLGRWFSGLGHSAGAQWQSWVRRVRTAGRIPPTRLRPPWPRPRNSREHVWLLYLLSLQETGRLASPRAPADTPYEYARRAAPQLAEATADLQAVTEAFIHARYSPRNPAPGDLGRLRAAYRRLRQACRRRLAGQREPPDAEPPAARSPAAGQE